MLNFFDSAWHVFSGLLIFSIGLIAAFTQKKLFEVPRKRAITLYLWHTFFCIFYFWYSLNNNADSIGYYLNSFGYKAGFKFGTSGVYYFVSFFTQGLGLSYGNVFLIFNVLGYIGLLGFASALQSVTVTSRRDIKKYSTFFLFLPGVSFWSAAIGKDAITFLASGLITWAILNASRRWPAIVLGTLLFLAPRPHMAGIVLLAFSLALLISSNLGKARKIAFLVISVPLCVIGVQFGLDYAGLGDAGGLNDVGDYFEARQGYNLGGGEFS